ncbi:MAG: hypothetical protein GIKADHBN_01607 [Phycisphaerales bacterium]|nr:hypothetical protein [Phycisphaerales bacterium]
MKKSRRWSLPSLLGLNRLVGASGDRGHRSQSTRGARGLARRAGGAGRPVMENLEARRLLFSMTISESDIDPATGLGTRVAYFGYLVPYLIAQTEVEETDPVVVNETFNDELNNNVPALNVISGTVFLGSNIRTRHSITPASSYQLVQPNAPAQQEKLLRYQMQAGQFFEFSATDGLGNVRFAQAVDMDLLADTANGSTTGWDTDNIEVQLFYNGELIRSYAGNTLRAAKITTGGTPGTGTFRFEAPEDPGAFDTIRVVANAGPNDTFFIDNLVFTLPSGAYSQIINGSIFGASVSITGPVGATVQVLDLYGRDMVETLGLGTPEGSQVPLVDPGGNGIPDFNDGIGRIVVSGGDSRTSVWMHGGTIVPVRGDPDPDIDFIQGAWGYRNIEALAGQFSQYEQAGFGYHLDLTQPEIPPPDGLPPVGGSVVVGSPFVRPQDDYRPGSRNVGDLVDVFGNDVIRITGGNLDVIGGFTNPNQGVFVNGSIGQITIHGLVHGSSRITGTAGTINLGYSVGSFTVDGDVGSFITATDDGRWTRDDGSETINTLSQYTFGRTVGDISIAGRAATPVTVIGDTSNPSGRPPRDVFTYKEREFAISESAATYEVEFSVEDNQFFYAVNPFGDRVGYDMVNFLQAASVFGNMYLRNDSVMNAEFVGTASGGVRIQGSFSARETVVNTQDDDADVYAFAADGTQPINIQIATEGSAYIRIVDQDGRTISSIERPRGANNTFRAEQTLSFTAPTPGIYYAVVTDGADSGDDGVAAFLYSLVITGMAPTTLGMFRTGGSSSSSVTLLGGSMGQMRVGTAYVVGTGAETSINGLVNAGEATADDLQNWTGGTLTVPGHLYGITAGSDIQGGFFSAGDNDNPISVFVGGNFGSLYTGQSAVVGRNNSEGDIIGFFRLQTGGSVALIDVRAGIGNNTDDDSQLAIASGPGDVRIVTGRDSNLRGDIGMIRVGRQIAGDALQVDTPAGSVVGALLVQQDQADTEDTRQGMFGSEVGAILNLGPGSDLRFFDTPYIDLRDTDNADTLLFENQVVRFTDDAGGDVEIRVVGATTGRPAGRIVSMPIDGSQGVAVGRIEVDLSNGASLEIRGVGNAGSQDIISIGRIVILAAGTGSGVTIAGNVQIDIFSLTSAAPLAFIRNETPLGDFVSIDVNSVTDVTIFTGDLGRTQVPAWGPRLIGPFLGIGGTSGPNTTAIPLDGAQMTPDWNGGLYRGIADDTNQAGNLFLDDVGSPFDPYLNGIIVRTGNLEDLEVGGAIGDVLVPAGDVVRVTANFDRATASGRFDGIVGTVFGQRVLLVEVGDGLAANTGGALSTTGVFAYDDIIQVFAERITGAFISGPINASDSVAGNTDNFLGGIDVVRVNSKGGGYDRAYIGSMLLDDFWESYFGETSRYAGTINLIDGRGANMFGCTITANDINTVRLTEGVWDANVLTASDNIQTITAAEYRNSTLVGGSLEVRANRINATGNVGIINTASNAGDMNDLGIDVIGDVTGSISARNFTRVTIDVSGDLKLVNAVLDLRASRIQVGSLPALTAGRNIQSSEIFVSGVLDRVTAGSQIVNTTISMTGPDGEIRSITASSLISGEISASGPIGLISATTGDIRARITTTTARGNVSSLVAARDLDISTDISGTIVSLEAGRHIGNRAAPGSIVIRGNLTDVTAGGQLYSDLRVGQSISGTVSISRVAALPTNNQLGSGSIIAFGSINAVEVEGDFGGDIISYSGGIRGVTITNGSFLPGRRIAAYDGDVVNVAVVNGDLLGSVYADYILWQVSVIGSEDGVFGDVGVNPFKSSNTAYDAFRNQLPVGVAASTGVDGPTISAGWNVGVIYLSNGSMFETSVIAGRAIGYITVFGEIANDPYTSVHGTVIAAADSIWSVGTLGPITNTDIIAGVVNFGQDRRPGGTGNNADIVKSGWINQVYAGGGAINVTVSAGMLPVDGIYNNGNELVASGLSVINAVTIPAGMTVGNVTVYSDNLSASILSDARLISGGYNFAIEESELWNGFQPLGVPVTAAGVRFTRGSATGTIYFAAGAGSVGGAFWNESLGRLWLVNTGYFDDVHVAVDGAAPTLADFDVVTNDDASIRSLYIGADLTGDSDIIIDAYAVYITTGRVSGTGEWSIGADVDTITTNGWAGGTYDAKLTSIFNVLGDLGNANYAVRNEAYIGSLAFGNVLVSGFNKARISADRDLNYFVTQGVVDGATIRAGSSMVLFQAASLSRTWLSVRDTINEIEIEGDVFDSSLMAGVDLGRDTEFDKTATPAVLDADDVSTGFIGSVSIGGNFVESDITAGIIRGADGFFGTNDDSVAEGRSSIGNVVIKGGQTGSDRLSEAYRISSSGTIGTVTIGGTIVNGSRGNFAVQRLVLPPLPFQVIDLQTQIVSSVAYARIFFNQPTNASTVASALSIYELRDDGATQIRLVLNVDYTVSYDTVNDAAVITFSRQLTERNLPQQPGVPGPGVYRFELDQSRLRAKLSRSSLDGDANGLSPSGDNFSQDDFVGDVGDRVEDTQVTTGGKVVDLYGAANLGLVLDDNRSPDGLPDVNKQITIRGFLGDHPDHDANLFRFSGDADVYKLTLQAGQILRLGGLQGSAQGAFDHDLYDAAGQFVTSIEAIAMPADEFVFGANPDRSWLVKQTGTYYIVVSNGADITSGAVYNPNPVSGGVGDYSFTVEVFDDGDTGFNAPTDSGNGANLGNAPAPIAFAGPNGVFNQPTDANYDDLTQIIIGEYIYTLNAGTDGVRGTSDDLVSGSNAAGTIVATHSGTGRQTATVTASIGAPGAAGLPGDITPDVDIFKINNGNPIAAGTKVKVTVKLAELGSDLGSRSQIPRLISSTTTLIPEDLLGDVQFGIFDLTGSVATDDGALVFSPSDFTPTAGKPGIIAANSNASYGYDSNGDFFVEFLAPESVVGSGNASLAVYIQGVYNTDYRVEVALDGSGTITQTVQNVLVETRGGSVNWLEASGRATQLSGFNAQTLGFNGTLANNQDVQSYIIQQVVARLQQTFDAAGLAVNFSANPADFEFQPFSTVFLTSSSDPVTLLFGDNFIPTVTLTDLLFPDLVGTLVEQPYGYSEHTDAFNADDSDEAVVFVPPMGLLGFSNSQSDVDRFVQSLTAAIGRRTGELLGLRLTDSFTPAPSQTTFDIMASDSVADPEAASRNLALFGNLRLLSGVGDSTVSTDFYLGAQSAVGILSQYIESN